MNPLIDMLDNLDEQQKQWKRERAGFQPPVFAKKSISPKSPSPVESDTEYHDQNMQLTVPQHSSKNSQKESMNDSATQDYHFALTNLVKPERALFQQDDEIMFYNQKDTSFQDLNDEMDKEIHAIQREYHLPDTPQNLKGVNSSGLQTPKSRFQSFSVNNYPQQDITEHSDSDSEEDDKSTNNVTRHSNHYIIPKSSQPQQAPPTKTQKPQQKSVSQLQKSISPNQKSVSPNTKEPVKKPLLNLKIDYKGHTELVSVYHDTKPEILMDYLCGKFGERKAQRITELAVNSIIQYTEALQEYIEYKNISRVDSEAFKKHCKNNGNFLLGIQNKSTNRSESVSSPTKRSLSQLSKESYYDKDRSARSLHASSLLMQRHASPVKSTKQLKVSPSKEPHYYDFNTSPNCSKNTKLTKLMKVPPNMTTSRDVDEIYIKSISKKNEFVTFELGLGGNRVGKITLNRKKVVEENQLKLLHQKLQVGPQQSGQPKEITTNVEKFCIRHKLNQKQYGRLVKLLANNKELA